MARSLTDIMEDVRERGLQVLKLVLWIGAPVAIPLMAVAMVRSGAALYLLVESIGLIAALIGVTIDGPVRRRAGLLVGGLLLVSIGALLHFGPTLGGGLFFAGALISGVFFFGRAGVVVSTVVLVVALVLAGPLGVYGLHPGGEGPVEPYVAVRATIAGTIALSFIAVVLDRIQVALNQALVGQIEARERQARAEREREEALTAAMQSQRLEAVGRLASGVAHDFNNTLLVMQSCVDLLGDDLDAEEMAEIRDDLRGAIDAATATTRQLLGFTRQRDPLGTCEPQAVVERIASSYARLLPDGASLTCEAEATLPIPLSAGGLEQLLINLILNARDALPDGRGTITLRCSSDGDDVVIEVRDDGSGMDAQTRERVFEPFFTTKGDDRGTGLGLAMVWGVVARLHGRVEIDSAPGEGTTVRMRLPLAPPAPSEDVDTLAPVAHEGSLRILLVEDQADVRRVMTRVLESGGYTVHGCATVAESHAAMDARPFDGLVTDGRLPDGSAVDVIRAWRARRGDAPALVCTGYVEDEVIEQIRRTGTIQVLHKPFERAALLGAVQAALPDPTQHGAAHAG